MNTGQRRFSCHGVAALLSLLFLVACGLCGNEIVSEVESPSGKQKPVIFQRDCGATTGFSTQISVLRKWQSLPDDGGNVFIADDDHGAVPLGAKGTMNVRIRWESETALVISYPEKARIFRKETTHRGVSIRYESAKE